MTKFRWRWLLVLMAFALVAASCGDSDDSTSSGSSNDSATTTTAGGSDSAGDDSAETPEPEDATNEEPESVEKTKIVWLALDWPNEDVIAAFEADNPDIEVEVEAFGFGELFEQIQIRMSAGDSSPDVVTVDGPRTSSYGLRGWIEPLDGIFTQDEIEDWPAESFAAGQYNGDFIGAPLSTSTQLLYYNKPLLDQAGIAYPGQDERLTWEEITTAALAVQAANPDATGFNWEQMVQIYQLQPLAVSLGGEALGADGLTAEGVINSAEWVEAMTYYWEVYNEHGFAPQGEVLWTPDRFETGDVALMVAGPWNIGRFANSDVLNNDDWGVSRHPAFEGGDIAVPTGGWNLGINANSENKEAAARFVHWMTTATGQESWFRFGAGDPPSSLAVMDIILESDEFSEWPLSANQVMAKEAAAGPELRPITVAYLEYEAIFSDAFQDIRNGTDPKEALDLAAQRMEREFDKYR